MSDLRVGANFCGEREKKSASEPVRNEKASFGYRRIPGSARDGMTHGAQEQIAAVKGKGEQPLLFQEVYVTQPWEKVQESTSKGGEKSPTGCAFIDRWQGVLGVC